MGTRIHVSGLSYFCTDTTLRQASSHLERWWSLKL